MAASSRSSLECMPAELLKMIFYDEALEKQDVIALGLCSKQLWQHMLQRVENAYRESAAPWAGTEMACIGTWLSDLPESFEKDNLAAHSIAKQVGLGRSFPARMVNWSAWRNYKQAEESPQDAWRSALNGLVRRKTSGVPESCWPRLEAELQCGHLFPKVYAKVFPNLCPEKRGWVLRNLDTKEYVRICASSEREGECVVDDADAQWLRLADMLVMRICWTSSIGLGPSSEDWKEFHRGRWAGHRFEIVMVLQDSLAGMDGWKDVTVEIVSEARKLRRRIRAHQGRQREHDRVHDTQKTGMVSCRP